MRLLLLLVAPLALEACQARPSQVGGVSAEEAAALDNAAAALDVANDPAAANRAAAEAAFLNAD